MEKTVEEIIGKEQTEELRNELWDVLSTDDCRYDDIEDIMMGYGLEMDYFESML